jgi:hypothetical protein
LRSLLLSRTSPPELIVASTGAVFAPDGSPADHGSSGRGGPRPDVLRARSDG